MVDSNVGEASTSPVPPQPLPEDEEGAETEETEESLDEEHCENEEPGKKKKKRKKVGAGAWQGLSWSQILHGGGPLRTCSYAHPDHAQKKKRNSSGDGAPVADAGEPQLDRQERQEKDRR